MTASLRHLWGDGEYFTSPQTGKKQCAAPAQSSILKPGVLPVSLPVQAARVLSAQAGPSLQITQATECGRTWEARRPPALRSLPIARNGVLVSETAVPASPLIRSGRLNVYVDGPLNTRNRGLESETIKAAILSFFFNRFSRAGTSGYGSTRIPARSQLARFLSESPFKRNSHHRCGRSRFASSVPVAACRESAGL